jgi:acetoin utilization deacetylase AcuC-like enzyme
VKVYSNDLFVLPLPDGHRFPMEKYRMLRERVQGRRDIEICQPPAASDEELLLAHTMSYVYRASHGLLEPLEQRRIGFPWSEAMIERSRRSVGATIAACRSALKDGSSASLAGGTHHACADHGEGFCVFNDTAVALLLLREEGRLRRAVVIDCDVHQGNGTAAILGHDPDLFTFSIHGEKNFPFRKQPSHLDIGLPDATGDEDYLGALAPALDRCLEHGPDLAIYLAGADPYEGDRLGRLALTKTGLERRDRMVYGRLAAAGIPVAVTMAGGYAVPIQDTVDIQTFSVTAALR